MRPAREASRGSIVVEKSKTKYRSSGRFVAILYVMSSSSRFPAIVKRYKCRVFSGHERIKYQD